MDKLLFISAALLLLCVKGTVENVAPAFIHACPGMKSDCLKKTIQETIPLFVKGIPQLDIMPLDPMHQENIQLTLPGGLKIEFKNGTVHGIRKCQVDNVKYDFDKTTADVNFHCNMTIKGRYKASGRILIITIDGDGDAKIKTTNAQIKCKLQFEDKIRNGIVYHEIKNMDVHHAFRDRVSFDLTNLFKGSPEISQTVLTFLNENWRQVADEFGGPIVDEIVRLVAENIKKFFHAIPKNELIIPE